MLRLHHAGLLAALVLSWTNAPDCRAQVVPSDDSSPLRLKLAEFDPLEGEPAVEAGLRSRAGQRLFIVQFAGRPTDSGRSSVGEAGISLHGYLPDNAYLVRGDRRKVEALRTRPGIRAIVDYHPAFRLSSDLRDWVLEPTSSESIRVHLVLVDKTRDRETLLPRLAGLGVEVALVGEGSLLVDVFVSPAQLEQVVRLDEVAWIDRWSPPELDMHNARAQGGADAVEAFGGYSGQGLNGHIYEGIEFDHPDFTNQAINISSGGEPNRHGHATAGIVFGNGTSDPLARGLVPDAQPFYTNFSSVDPMLSRYQVVESLVQTHDISFTTASWGNARTFDYTAVSADADDIVFDHGIVWSQSQSNAGDQASRPQAWAKNVISVGGVRHGNNADRADDSWAGGGSTGPAADGRIKPDLSAYFDGILTSDLTGDAGYTSGNSTPGFGGTSGATPIVAGFNGLAIQMFTDGLFGNTLRNPGGSRFSNRPKFTTHKALMIANARQYPFGAGSVTNRREQIGWGFPDLQQMLDNRNDMLIVDEDVVLLQGEVYSQALVVPADTPELKVCMVYADPAGNPASSIARINDLNLRVVAPDGTIYRGNVGLRDGNASTPGGAADDLDTVECVFVRRPMDGTWAIEVEALLVAMDTHVETVEVDADFGLVSTFGLIESEIEPIASGCASSVAGPESIGGVNESGGPLAIRSLSNEYCYPVTVDEDVTLTGFELYTASMRQEPVNVRTAVYLDLGGVPDPMPASVGTVDVDPELGFYRTELSVPISLVAGQTVYLGHELAFRTALCDLESGTVAFGFFRGTTQGGGSWSMSGLADRPAVRLLGADPGAEALTPRFLVTGLPVPGSTLVRSLRDAPPSATAVVLLGLSDPSSGPLSLPFDLGSIGASGCSLALIPDVVQPIAVDSIGTGRVDLPLPNSASLAGVEIFQQGLIFDAPLNPLGLSTTDAFRVRIAGR